MNNTSPVPDEIKEIVNDLMHGTSTSSKEEWVQRQYVKLMLRECNIRKLETESKFKQKSNFTNGNNTQQNRSNQ